MGILSRAAAAGCFLAAVLTFTAAAYRAEDAVTLQAQQIVRELDSMGVETKWIAGEHIYWENGLPTGVRKRRLESTPIAARS